MKVRNLKAYVEHLCDGKDGLDLLGDSTEPLFVKMYGEGPEDQVQATITSAASFAQKAEEQLFYEFVQNAFDANANSLMFFINKNYLIVLNNGDPFYTDEGRIFAKNARNGQLYSFLSKGKSAKRTDNTQMGKYGQGSKLLYTLITEVSAKNNESLLDKAIYKGKKGPYLISWNSKAQLDNLLLKQNRWEQADFADYERNILFAKILMSYYPVSPGVDQSLFSDKEALDAINAFDKLVDPRHSYSYLKKGTALIIPLGKGKYEKIIEKNNISKVKLRLAAFSAITANLNENKGKQLEHICIFGEEIEQVSVQSVFLKYEYEDEEFEYHFAFNPIFVDKDYVNFFKGLPILGTRYRLGFIVDSQNFEIDDARQNINDTAKTQSHLEIAFQHLVDELDNIWDEGDHDKFAYIYDSLIKCRFSTDEEAGRYVRDAFKAVIVPYIKNNIRTAEGSYTFLENALYIDSPITLPLEEVGFEDKSWVDEETFTILKRERGINIEVETKDFVDYIQECDEDALCEWICGLSEDDYQLFHKMCLDNLEDLEDYNLFRTNQGNLYSYNGLCSDINVYFFTEGNNNFFGDLECVEESMGEMDNDDYTSILFEKLKENYKSLRDTNTGLDIIASIIKFVYENDAYDDYKDFICDELYLFKDMNNEYRAMSDILIDRPEGSILYDSFMVHGYIPPVLKSKKFFTSVTDASAMFKWIYEHFKYITELDSWAGNTDKYLKDIQSVYDKIPVSKKTEDKLELYLDEDGIPQEDSYAYLQGSDKLSETAYNHLCATLISSDIVPYKYKDVLYSGAFTLDNITVDDAVDDGMIADIDAIKSIIKLSYSYFETTYRVTTYGNAYKLTKLGYGSGKNYVDSIQNTSLRAQLENCGLYYLPEQIQSAIGKDLKNCRFTSNENLVTKALNGLPNVIEFLPIIKQCNSSMINEFFKKVAGQNINVNSKLSEDGLIWDVISYAAKLDNRDYMQYVFHALRCNGTSLPETIVSQDVSVNEMTYSVYDLNPDYKEENQRIDKFLSYLPNEDARTLFIDKYYNGKKTDIDGEDLFNELKGHYLNVVQLEFCIDYAINNNEIVNDLEIDESVSLADAMDMIKKRQFSNFDSYFKIEGYNRDTQAYAPLNILTSTEKLPTVLHNWLEKNEDALILFKEMRTTQNDNHLAIRDNLKNDAEHVVTLSTFSDENDSKIPTTLEWMAAQKFYCAYGSKNYETINGIIRNLYEGVKPLLLLRYTGKIEKDESYIYQYRPVFELCKYLPGSPLMSSNSWTPLFIDLFRKDPGLPNYINSKKLFLYHENEFLRKHGIHKSPTWYVNNSVDVKSTYKEMTGPVYEKWKKKEVSKGISIMTSTKPVGVNFQIKSGNEAIYTFKVEDRDYGYRAEDLVVVKYPNEDKLTLMKTLEKHIDNLGFFFKAPFIALQGLYVEEFENLTAEAEKQGIDINDYLRTTIEGTAQTDDKKESSSKNAKQENNGDGNGDGSGKSNLDLSKSNLNEEQAQDILDKMTHETADSIDKVNNLTKQMSPEELDKLNEAAEPIKEIIDGLEKEDLELLAGKKEQIMEMLDDMADDEEERESKVRQIIGYIGELIFERYLKSKDKEYDFAADRGVGEYDFEIIGDKKYVDVKTTLYSLKDGTAPFYLHRSQNVFMQKHPESQYRIIRISLIDLKLQKSYERLRDIYGKDQDPRKNERLQKECIKIADKYWHGAKIEEFDAASPEYAIRIERKNNRT